MTDSYRIYSHEERQPGAGIVVVAHVSDPWDAYTEQDAIFVRYWEALVRTFPAYTFYICDAEDRLLASASSVPLRFEGDWADLPDGGWRWAVETAMQQAAQGVVPNGVSALGINVVAGQRGRGLSRYALEEMRRRAGVQGFQWMIAPVRPSQKHLYPLILMGEYAAWRRADGLLFDAWLRTHERLGAWVVRVAAASMVVRGTVAQWQSWTGMAFPGSGAHIVPGALCPVQINRAADMGEYVEPNVWMVHEW